MGYIINPYYKSWINGKVNNVFIYLTCIGYYLPSIVSDMSQSSMVPAVQTMSSVGCERNGAGEDNTG